MLENETTAPTLPKENLRKRILVVEDDEGIRETLRYVLELEGYEVFTAINGRLGLDLLSTIAKPNLILLDLMMPEMNGWEFIEVTEKTPSLAPIPIVVLTAFADKINTIQVKEVVKKPMDIDLLTEVVKKYCE